MNMCMSLDQGHRQELRQEQRLTQEQRQELRMAVLALRLDLIQEIHGRKYVIDANCPQCRRKLTPVEVISGFNQNPDDYTTRCPRCAHRFEAQLEHTSGGISEFLMLYCPTQTLAQLRGKEGLTPDDLIRDNPSAFHSAITHFGSISNAFKEAGVQYQHEGLLDWRIKVIPFLGHLPDKEIANCVGVSSFVIRTLRKKHHIARFDKRRALEAI